MHTGHCLCGAVRLEIAGEFLHAYYCHCSRCRRATASSFATNGFVRAEDLRIAAGEDALGRFESTPGVFRHFCARCGSQLFNRNDHVPQIRSVRLGVMDGDPGIRPVCHIFVGSKAPWTEIHDGLPTFLEANAPPPSFTPAEWSAARRFADTPFGRVAYVERGEGPAALFLHGFPLHGYHWRHQVAVLSERRRCIAPDLMGLGHTEIAPDQDLSFPAQADMLLALLDALGVERVDLVGNDSGGGIAQVLAAKAPGRLRSLVLTNCDTHDNWPPEAFRPVVELARKGGLGAALRAARDDTAPFAPAFERHEERAEAIAFYLEPVLSSEERVGNLERFVNAMDSRQTTAILPALEKLDVPTLVAWGLGDVYFAEEWADWLARTIPGVRRVEKIANARLFFPEERPFETITLIRRHWSEVEAGEGTA
jgi:pimeloyl-ACP methyl ester carboxylesterase